MTERCLYFGCWNEPGHFLHRPGGGRPTREDRCAEHYGDERRSLDGTLAPRRDRLGNLCWLGGVPRIDSMRLDGNSTECPQGQFLCHVLPNGFTAVQWWDRNQGDRRGACNSTILLEGEHTAEEVLAAGRLHFPHVFENLKRAGIELVERKLDP